MHKWFRYICLYGRDKLLPNIRLTVIFSTLLCGKYALIGLGYFYCKSSVLAMGKSKYLYKCECHCQRVSGSQTRRSVPLQAGMTGNLWGKTLIKIPFISLKFNWNSNDWLWFVSVFNSGIQLNWSFPLVLLHGNIYCPLYLCFVLFKANAVNIGEGNWQRLWKVTSN